MIAVAGVVLVVRRPRLAAVVAVAGLIALGLVFDHRRLSGADGFIY